MEREWISNAAAAAAGEDSGYSLPAAEFWNRYDKGEFKDWRGLTSPNGKA